jgi:hypothetical protein
MPQQALSRAAWWLRWLLRATRGTIPVERTHGIGGVQHAIRIRGVVGVSQTRWIQRIIRIEQTIRVRGVVRILQTRWIHRVIGIEPTIRPRGIVGISQVRRTSSLTPSALNQGGHEKQKHKYSCYHDDHTHTSSGTRRAAKCDHARDSTPYVPTRLLIWIVDFDCR